MQLRATQKIHSPLPDVLQDIVLSYLSEEDRKELQEFISYTAKNGLVWICEPLQFAREIFSKSDPWYIRMRGVFLVPLSFPTAAVMILIGSVVTIPLDVGRYAYKEIKEISDEIQNKKNQQWASFFVDVDREPKNSARSQRVDACSQGRITLP